MGIFIFGNSEYTQRVRDNDWTKILGWPGYSVYRHEIDEHDKTLKLWVRRKRGNRKLVCSGCGRKLAEACDIAPDTTQAPRVEEGEGTAVAEQSAVQQAL